MIFLWTLLVFYSFLWLMLLYLVESLAERVLWSTFCSTGFVSIITLLVRAYQNVG